MSKIQIPKEKKWAIQSLQKKYSRSATVLLEVKRPEEVHSYTTLATTRPAESPKRPWIKINYGN